MVLPKAGGSYDFNGSWGRNEIFRILFTNPQKMYLAERYLFHLDLVRRWYGLNMDKTLLSDCF
jgi:hypothetical protein